MDEKKLLIEIRSILRQELNQLVQKEVSDRDNISIKEASVITRLAVATIYVKCSQKTIPHYKKGKFLYFKRRELENWLDSGKQFFNGSSQI